MISKEVKTTANKSKIMRTNFIRNIVIIWLPLLLRPLGFKSADGILRSGARTNRFHLKNFPKKETILDIF